MPRVADIPLPDAMRSEKPNPMPPPPEPQPDEEPVPQA